MDKKIIVEPIRSSVYVINRLQDLLKVLYISIKNYKDIKTYDVLEMCAGLCNYLDNEKQTELFDFCKFLEDYVDARTYRGVYDCGFVKTCAHGVSVPCGCPENYLVEGNKILTNLKLKDQAHLYKEIYNFLKDKVNNFDFLYESNE